MSTDIITNVQQNTIPNINRTNLGNFFVHSNGTPWWDIAKFIFISGLIINFLICFICVYNNYFSIVSSTLFMVLTLVFYYIFTASGSCLRSADCPWLGYLQIILPILTSLVSIYLIYIYINSVYIEKQLEEDDEKNR